MHGKLGKTESAEKALRAGLRALPWLIFFGMLFGSIGDGLRDRGKVTRARDFFYCSASERMGYTSEIICGLSMLGSVIIEAHVVCMLIYRWKTRSLRRELLPMDSLVRLGLFSVYGVLGVVVAVVLIKVPDGPAPKYPFIFMSTLGVAVWLIFWTQKFISLMHSPLVVLVALLAILPRLALAQDLSTDSDACFEFCAAQAAQENEAAAVKCNAQTALDGAKCICDNKAILADVEACVAQKCPSFKGTITRQCGLLEGAAVKRKHSAAASFAVGAGAIVSGILFL
ncbi:hypothetical protein AURDEDRAFT_166470 [Auricularia subglabra TFB-10046 SS5]|nr:hypothetical protein AURDEDRAFT_166470 [Auricularia subglabra TFB-10046 SS5]